MGKRVRSERALRELGWKATTPFDEGLARYVTWYRSRQVEQHESWSRVDEILRT